MKCNSTLILGVIIYNSYITVSLEYGCVKNNQETKNFFLQIHGYSGMVFTLNLFYSTLSDVGRMK